MTSWLKVGNTYYNRERLDFIGVDPSDAKYLVAQTGTDDSLRFGPYADAATALTKLGTIVGVVADGVTITM